MKKMVALWLILSTLGFSGCGLVNTFMVSVVPAPPVPAAPEKLVKQISVTQYPNDPTMDRHYQDPENVDAILALLNSLRTEDYPEIDPELQKGKSYFTITATYTNNLSHQYYLLENQYLSLSDEMWMVVSPEASAKFIEFLNNNPSDEPFVVPMSIENTYSQIN